MTTKNIFLGKINVRDSAVLIDSRILASILQVKPINLTTLDESERLELTNQYRYFLRSLAFPMQIILRLENKDSEKFLYRKRMADVEEIIKKTCKRNFKEVLAESDSFKNWLKPFLEMNARPMLLCYIVIPVIAGINLAKNEVAYVEALQLLNQRTSDCISRLSSIKIRKKINPNTKRCEWEQYQFQKFQEKKAMIALNMLKRNGTYHSLSTFNSVTNGQKIISDYMRDNFYDDIIAEKEIMLEVRRLNDDEILNLFDSYCKDHITLSNGQNCEHIFIKDLFNLMSKATETEGMA